MSKTFKLEGNDEEYSGVGQIHLIHETKTILLYVGRNLGNYTNFFSKPRYFWRLLQLKFFDVLKIIAERSLE